MATFKGAPSQSGNGLTATDTFTMTVTAAPTAYTLSGTVTAGGPGLDGAAVHAFDSVTNAYFGTSVTTAGGAYAFSLPAGTYKLFVQPDEPGFADQWKGVRTSVRRPRSR